jgi:hypothetical protein
MLIFPSIGSLIPRNPYLNSPTNRYSNIFLRTKNLIDDLFASNLQTLEGHYKVLVIWLQQACNVLPHFLFDQNPNCEVNLKRLFWVGDEDRIFSAYARVPN